MPDQYPANVTPEDIQAVGEKLEEFCQALPPREQAALTWLMQRAAMAPQDSAIAQGYAVVFTRSSDAEGQAAGLPFRFETTWSVGDQDT